MKLGVVVLAAGQGTRMRSERPKVLHALAGRSMVAWVLASLDGLAVADCVVVVGHGADQVAAALPAGVSSALQAEQKGTGHAAQIGLGALDATCDTVLILCGDTPLVRSELIAQLVAIHVSAGRPATMVTAVLDDAGAYGRVLRSLAGDLDAVVEARDATPEQLEVGEINAGIYVADRAALEAALAGVGTDNAQGEIYLPDALPLMGGPVGIVVSDDPLVVAGVNNRIDLADCEAELQRRLRERLMLDGVTMTDPTAVFVDHDVRVGRDTVLLPGVHLRKGSTIGEACAIGPDCIVSASHIGDRCTLITTHVYESAIADDCQLGPFAYLRPGNQMHAGAKVGTYVEMKNTTLGAKAKVPHLSYVGDAEIGEATNIGAGNITANYDGFRKHRTVIGARVRTGSDCVFVAPVTVGDDAMTAAGSIITHGVPAGALGIARSRQSVIEGFTAKATARAAAANEKDKGNA